MCSEGDRGDDHERPAPAEVGQSPDHRQRRDPRCRLAHDRPRDHVGSPARRSPLRRRGQTSCQDARRADADRDLRQGEQREARRERAARRAGDEQREPAVEQLRNPEAASRCGHDDRRRQTGDGGCGSQLAGPRHGDVELLSDLSQRGGEYDVRRLGCEEREEEAGCEPSHRGCRAFVIHGAKLRPGQRRSIGAPTQLRGRHTAAIT
jgi:hypothetical protein